MRMQGQLDTALSAPRPLAGRARRRVRWPARASRRSSPATWSAPPTPRRRWPRPARPADHDRRRPARAQLRHVPGLHLRRDRRALAGPRRRAGGTTIRTFAPEGGETLRRVQRPRRRGLRPHRRRPCGPSIAVVTHGGVLDCLYRAATGASALGAPRSWELGNAAINRLLYTPRALHPGRLERHRPPRRRDDARRRQRGRPALPVPRRR